LSSQRKTKDQGLLLLVLGMPIWKLEKKARGWCSLCFAIHDTKAKEISLHRFAYNQANSGHLSGFVVLDFEVYI